MTKKSKKFTITKEQQRKIARAAQRIVDLENNNFIRGGAHKSSKKDIHAKTKNTIRDLED